MKHKIRRRFFKITEIKMLKLWAESGKSQSYAAKALNRSPGVIANVAIRNNIKFNAKSGRPKGDKIQIRQRQTEATKRWRRRHGIPARIYKTKPKSIIRFDDPKVMI